MRGFDVASARVRPEPSSAEAIRCESCHGLATCKATWSSGSNFLCYECLAGGQADTDEVEAHEMSVFGAAWGIPERPVVTPIPFAGRRNADVIGLRARCESRRKLGIYDGETDGDGEEMATLTVPLLMLERALDAISALENSPAGLADAHSKSPSRPAMPKEEDTHG